MAGKEELDMLMIVTYRGYTIMRNLAIAFVVTFVSFVVFGLGAVMPLLAPIGGVGFLICAIGSVVAPVVGLLFPVRTDEPISDGRWNFALVGWLGAVEAVAVLVIAVWLGCGMYKSGRKVDGMFPDRKAMERDRFVGSFPLDHLLPKEAKDISFKGRTGIGGLGWQAEFKCRVSESDFAAFSASHDWVLVTNRFENANAATADHSPDNPFWGNSSIENPFVVGQAPKHFVSYYYLKSNYGGICLALDLETGILYGQYSSN